MNTLALFCAVLISVAALRLGTVRTSPSVIILSVLYGFAVTISEIMVAQEGEIVVIT
jgi:hypothetical protein